MGIKRWETIARIDASSLDVAEFLRFLDAVRGVQGMFGMGEGGDPLEKAPVVVQKALAHIRANPGKPVRVLVQSGILHPKGEVVRVSES